MIAVGLGVATVAFAGKLNYQLSGEVPLVSCCFQRVNGVLMNLNSGKIG